MKRKLYKDLILVLIFQTKGKWSWYQLERELEWRGIAGKVKVTEVVNQLVADNLVSERIDPSVGTGMPYYSVTDEGSDAVRELVDRLGADAFSRKKENKNDYE